ncbi:MAG: ATP-dependent Clp protease adapter ClpS [Nitrospirota bacterium]|uniref:ATP-dependent Clp protease adapter protein ClpS n=1 Tax=Candidatus Magnetominusculus xianensis TaxID=1748249 RepID=A0ABR5SCI9_9BACT|nr:ATP-dependent Clp protease adapter ClpS [Candidatus Magnetominusculus xianensis]KWT81175.1 ATP-dependent Clp protease adapter protein ClpS [Candidatus Magnetominusculus xianensis]MBF0404311.1 ATP-dependent Clp protease adapter ClpS [Nitrospirota bacterium]
MSERKFRELFEDMTSSKLKLPPMFKVYLLNDDYTTMDFVVTVLETIFHKTAAEATQIMLHVHKQGSGLCGVYTKDIAETKVVRVRELAEKNDFPLMCMMEEE